MTFNKEDYILHTYDVGGDDMEYVYVYCKQETIPLECYGSLREITTKEDFEGNMIYLNKNGVGNFNHFIFTEGNWYVALMTSELDKFTERKSRLRNIKIDSVID